MSYEAADRVLSISFVRDPEEHADMMLQAGRRMVTETDSSVAWWKAIGTAIGFGVVVAIVMELYRRILLPVILDPSEIAPFGTAALELLPLILLVVALFAFLYARASRRRRRVLISRLRPGVFVDVDIFSKGICVSNGGQSTVEVDWPAVRNIFAVRDGMEIECEVFVFHIPLRAFASRAAFNEAGQEIRNVWREALKREHDGKMIAAGLD